MMDSLAKWASLAVALLSLSSAGCGGPGPPPPDVVLITLDTTRADRLGCYGNDRIATPNLDRLAGQGVRFDRAFTPVPSTLPSHSSILTGLHPARHGVHDNGIYRLEESFETLAESLRDMGYQTAAFVSAYVLDRRFGLAQGFQVYDDTMDLPLKRRSPGSPAGEGRLPEPTRQWIERQSQPYQRRAQSVTEAALEWLRRPLDEPLFLWVHYFDPHMSYDPPSPWATHYDPQYEGELDGTMAAFLRLVRSVGGFAPGTLPRDAIDHMVARYDGEISYMDHWIGRLLAALESTPRWTHTLVVVVADHGEGFGEHGQFWEHNGQIFDELMRVPLIIKRPGPGRGGSVDPRLVSTIDVVPTILNEVGSAKPRESQGVALFAPPERAPRHLLFEALHGRQVVPQPHSWLGLRSRENKLILLLDRKGHVERSGFYDLVEDPGERVSRHDSHREEVARWQHEALEQFSRLQARGPAPTTDELDPEMRKALEALGYVN